MNHKIIIDGRGAILYAGTGIGTYTRQLICHLQKENPNIIPLLPGEEYRDYHFREQIPMKDTELFRRKLFLPKYLQKQQAGILHIPQNGIGLPQQKCCKEVVTVHDMIPYFYPETVGKGYLKEFLKSMPEIIHRSDAVITVSQYAKRSIIQFFPEAEEKLHVIPEAADSCFIPLPKQKTAACLKEHHIEKNYILYVGGFSPRKNLKALILAFYLLQKTEPSDILLVLPGKRGKENDEAEQLIEALGIKDKVLFPGYLTSTELCCFYNGASVMVYPSICEGFGLPPLEAMACGTPVIAARSSSLPEVLGDAALYFDPFNSADLANQLHRLLRSEALRKMLSQKGLMHAQKYRWEETARQTSDLYAKLLTKA